MNREPYKMPANTPWASTKEGSDVGTTMSYSIHKSYNHITWHVSSTVLPVFPSHSLLYCRIQNGVSVTAQDEGSR